jgi:putative hydrolase of the HAD superfamily
MQQIKALTFDLDDTLWDSGPVLMAAERTLYDWLALRYPRIGRHYTLEGLREMRLELLRQRPELGHNMTELRKLSLRLAADTVGYDHSLVEPAFEVFLRARHRIRLYDDVIPALQAFKRAGYRVASMTNGNADVVRLGLGHLFDFSLSAERVGKGKPHPLIFATACRHAAVEPVELVHIGDDPTTDLAGGQAAGVKVVWMNRRRRSRDPGVEMDAEVHCMHDLLSLFGLA